MLNPILSLGRDEEYDIRSSWDWAFSFREKMSCKQKIGLAINTVRPTLSKKEVSDQTALDAILFNTDEMHEVYLHLFVPNYYLSLIT